MAKILSLERHYSHQAVAAVGRNPDTTDSRHSRLVQLSPDHTGTELASLQVFFLDDSSVVRGSSTNADTVAIKYLVAIGAGIDDAGVRIAHNIDARRTNEPAAVEWVPDRYRESLQIHFVVAQDILLNRSSLHVNRRNRGEAFEQFSPKLQQPIVRGFCGIQAERYGLTFARAHGIDQDAVARLEVRDLVEKNRRALFGMIQHLGDGADVFLGIRALNSF